MPDPAPDAINDLVDHLFRHKAGQMIAILTSLFGIENLDAAEDVVQETLIQALRRWPYTGIPANPGGWLIEVAKNRAVDRLRHEARFKQKVGLLIEWPSASSDGDDVLVMMFICCDPSLPRDAQIALTLKAVGGFSVKEIARTFLTSEATVAQRLVRAKRRLKEQGADFALPQDAEVLRARLDAVLSVLYLIFNEGYAAHSGEDLVRRDLCGEAIRLCNLLSSQAIGDVPQVWALLALMLFQASRLGSRTDAAGDVMQLAEQDRSQWDAAMIQQGFAALNRAMHGETLSDYHLQAGIAACHAAAPSFEQTDWDSIMFYYDTLTERSASPIIALNRTVAVAMRYGAAAGIDALREIEHLSVLRDYYLLPATYGEFYARLGRFRDAAECYRQAVALTQNEAEQRFLVKKIDQCEAHSTI